MDEHVGASHWLVPPVDHRTTKPLQGLCSVEAGDWHCKPFEWSVASPSHLSAAVGLGTAGRGDRTARAYGYPRL